MTNEKKAMTKCMGWPPNREQCVHCRRLPLTPKQEDTEMIDPPHFSPCSAYKPRGK